MVETFCLLQYVIFQLITKATRFKYVTGRYFSPTLIKLHLPPCCSLCMPSIHPPCRATFPVSSSLLISCDHTIFLFTYSFFTISSPHFLAVTTVSFFTQTFILFLLCQSVHFISSVIFGCAVFLYNHLFQAPHPQPFCQSSVTAFVAVGLSVSMSSHSQQ
ncbi:hypothetical protein AMECASPLE_037805 [Ameca splendens]|uniref:Uncharacterized protein n=1 Tax=Ameca splendens TaxID=208324 RepID=A0ABV0YV44_9TELE